MAGEGATNPIPVLFLGGGRDALKFGSAVDWHYSVK